MYEYLSSIGFETFKDKKIGNKLIEMAITSPSEKYISNFGEDVIKVRIIKYVGDRLGFLLHGELDEQEEIKVENIIPYLKGKFLIDTNEVDVEKVIDMDEYNVSCEDTEAGIPISFYLQNVVEYLEVKDKKDVYINGIRLVGISKEGSIILPIDKDEEDIIIEDEEEQFHSELLQAARDGDEEALELLAFEEEEISEMIEERLKYEDLFSIIDGYFMPYGLNGEEYAILANIKEVQLVKNNITNKKVYIIGVKCLGLEFEVIINKEELVGQPEVGRRFKGIVWLQGHLEFRA